ASSAFVASAEVARALGGQSIVETDMAMVAAAAQPSSAALSIGVLISISLSVLIGTITFSGSFVAFGKLSGRLSGNPTNFPGMRLLTVVLILGAIGAATWMVMGSPELAADANAIVVGCAVLVGIAFLLGILLVIPIGGADMPVVVALLNSYSGLAAAATGFVLGNYALIVSGALVGASGLILTNIMCEAMNRSLANVLLGGFGGDSDAPAIEGPSGDGAVQGTYKQISADDAAVLLTYADKVVVVPGYGMAVAQAQHAVRELADLLQDKGVTVKYGIHPVAGRMPGHMNVLLAEANVPYDQLFDMDEINPDFESTDVTLVIGANDVVNPAARSNPASPIYGMPVLDVERSANTIVLKRSMRPGYAGVDNELFYRPRTSMLFGDAKDSITDLVQEVKTL
ncbi:MAG: NAD(P)(+) transhydrogenase (Re/Si-specific) subunit beta, partial [Bacteroidota bacterium]